MKLDLEKQITDLQGNPIELSATADSIMEELNKDQPAANAVQSILALTKAKRTPITLQTEGVRVLLATTAEQSANEKFEHARLAEKLMEGNKADLTLDEAKTLRDAIGKYSTAIIVLRCWDIIDHPIAEKFPAPSPAKKLNTEH